MHLVVHLHYTRCIVCTRLPRAGRHCTDVTTVDEKHTGDTLRYLRNDSRQQRQQIERSDSTFQRLSPFERQERMDAPERNDRRDEWNLVIAARMWQSCSSHSISLTRSAYMALQSICP